MRLYTEVIAVSLVSAIVAWARQAPPDPDQRASYLCKPVASAAALLQRFESAMREDGRVAAPWQPWRVEPAQGCQRFVRRLLPDSSAPDDGVVALATAGVLADWLEADYRAPVDPNLPPLRLGHAVPGPRSFLRAEPVPTARSEGEEAPPSTEPCSPAPASTPPAGAPGTPGAPPHE